jgi:hypothetical protein
MADNAKAPAGNDATAAAEGDNQGSDALAAAKAALEHQKRQYEDLRRLTTRATQENAELRKRFQDQTARPDFGASDETSPELVQAIKRLEQQNANLMAEVGETKFKQDHSDWQDYWPRIQEMIQDPVKVNEIASYGKGGQADVYRSLVNARREAENEKARVVLKAQSEHKGKETAEVERQKRQATISGVSASPTDDGLTVDSLRKMGAKAANEAILRSGALADMMDPSDPMTGSAGRK